MPNFNRDERMRATREAAAALVEDLEYMRNVLARLDACRGELRRLSAVLRRLVVERDLSDVAAPRIGRVFLPVPDNKPVLKAERDRPYAFFASGGVAVFGMYLRAAIGEQAARPRELEDFDPDRTALVKLDGFLSQPVLCNQGTWFNRREVIKYVANIASGVHSDRASEPQEVALASIRRSVTYRVQDETVAVQFQAVEAVEGDFRYSRDAIDPVLVEILAAAQFISDSEDVRRLEEGIRGELS
jgi:hypothetical protein